MKIKKYNQSCLLIETNNKRILVDPGVIGYDNYLDNEWINIDYILVTHRHSDHCYSEIINNIIERDHAILYTTKEVVDNNNFISYEVVKENDVIDLQDIKIEVVKAVHGFWPKMKNGGEIKENVGYIIDDGRKRLYTTSDTICFNNNYHCDILCMPFNGNGLTMGIVDGIMFIEDINPEIVLPIHREHPMDFMNPSKTFLDDELTKKNINHYILDNLEEIQIGEKWFIL